MNLNPQDFKKMHLPDLRFVRYCIGSAATFWFVCGDGSLNILGFLSSLSEISNSMFFFHFSWPTVYTISHKYLKKKKSGQFLLGKKKDHQSCRRVSKGNMRVYIIEQKCVLWWHMLMKTEFQCSPLINFSSFFVVDVESLSPVSSPSSSALWCMLLLGMCSSYFSWRVCYDYITSSDHILVDAHI